MMELDGFQLEIFQYLGDDAKPVPEDRLNPNDDLKTYGTKHVCLWVEDDQWDALIAHLEEKGANIVVRAEHPPEKLNKPTSCKVIFLLDPDGTSVEVQQSFTPGEYGL